jgi:hypothetical protein
MLRISRLIAFFYLLLCLVSVGLMAAFGPLGYAPYPLPLGPTREPIVVTIAYSTEKQAWLEQAAAQFAAADRRVDGRPIEIVLQGAGSREMVGEVARGALRPTAISPASFVQIELLRDEWGNSAANSGTPIGAGELTPQPLVLTPLVLVGWEERTALLWPNGEPANLWADLHNAVAEDKTWQDLGGRESWGFVKFGHTRPTSSNSGIQTLLLMAYAYHNTYTGLTVESIEDQGFRSWMAAIERSVSEFGDSTAPFMDSMVLAGHGKDELVDGKENHENVV